jgi:murein DD-endopeptidase MepM/ murein hydrolase activator NlpD
VSKVRGCLGLLILVVAPVAALLVMSTGTALKVDPPVKAIGASTPVKVQIDNPHGVRRITAVVEQNGTRHTVFEQRRPADRFLFWRRKEAPREITFKAGKDQAPALRDGKARLTIEAQSNDLRARADSVAFDVEVATQPPRVQPDDAQHYLNQGGSELVTFQLGGYWTEAGVQVGPYRFRSFPIPGQPAGRRFAIFAYPWDLAPDVAPRVYARNPAGAEATGRFWHKVFPKRFRSRELVLDDAFLDKVVNQIDPGGTGDLLARFLKINGDLRRQNNQTLADLRFKTEERVLWSGPFVQLSNSQVESQFADVRTYVYQGKKVDQQVHLGFDLSVTRNVPVVAANDGKVIFAADLGIYGNCVVVDHGYGLQSIYGHLSQIGVKEGDAVKKGQPLGNSGSTGLAGGDHLHFSMQVDGVQVNPVEWWDGHWIQDRILSKLPVQ